MRLSVLIALLVLFVGCNRDPIDSGKNPPLESTTVGATDTATTAAPSDTSTTTRAAEPVHPETPATTTT